MRARLLVAFLLGAALGAAALWHVTGPRELTFPHAQAGPDTVRVLVARQELSYGQRLLPKHLQWVEWPKDDVPPGSFTDVKALLGENGDQTRTVLRTIEPGEPILQSKISGIGESPRTAVELGEGRRAVSRPIGSVQGISGFVAPGDRVEWNACNSGARNSMPGAIDGRPVPEPSAAKSPDDKAAADRP